MRILLALAAGLVVGTILVEAMLAGLLVLLPDSFLRVQSVAGPLVWPLLTLPALVWVFGGGACGAMAVAVCGRLTVGLLGGALMGGAVFVIVNVATPGNALGLAAAALPLAGSAAGALLATGMRQADATVSATSQRV